MKGLLKLIVLKELEKEPLTGYQLLGIIEKKFGKKPSTGSLYPLLKELKKLEYISAKKTDRKIVYSLTANGQKYSKKKSKLNQDIILQKIAFFRKMHKNEKSKDTLIEKALLKIGKESFDFGEGIIEFIHFRNLLLKIFLRKNHNDYKKQVLKILVDATKKLEKI